MEPNSFDYYFHWLGIPPENRPPNHYQLLGCREYEPDVDVIVRLADHRMAQVKRQGEDIHYAAGQQLLYEMALARLCLTNAQTKAGYDQQLASKPVQGPPLARSESDSGPLDDERRPVGLASQQRTLVKRNRQNSSTIFWLSMLGLAVIVVIVLLASRGGEQPSVPTSSLAVDGSPSDKSGSTPTNDNSAAHITPQDKGGDTRLAIVVKEVAPSLVRIETRSGALLGTGVIVDDEGFVLTNYHVGPRSKIAKIVLNSGTRISVLGFAAVAQERDLLLLKTEPFEKSLSIKIARELPRRGESVAAFFNSEGREFSTSAGAVSALLSGREVSKMFRDDVWKSLGYTLDAKWIQHTAVISEIDSCGPLVNMRGELVGFNAGGLDKGGLLNFAIGAPDINRLLGTSDDQSSPNPPAPNPPRTPQSEPKGQQKPEQPPERKLFSDPFPSGHTFSPVLFEAEPLDDQTLKALDEAGQLIVIKYRNRSPAAIASNLKGKLNGVTIRRYEIKQPLLYANYWDGKRHGLFEYWNEMRQPVYFAQYTKGMRDGFLCFFQDGKLCMMIEYRVSSGQEKLNCIRVISGTEVVGEFLTKADANSDPTAQERLADLAIVENSLRDSEKKFKDEVRDAYRAFVAPFNADWKRQKREAERMAAEAARSAEREDIEQMWNNWNPLQGVIDAVPSFIPAIPPQRRK